MLDYLSTEEVKFRLSRNQFFKPVRNIEKIGGSSVDIASNDVSCARMNLNMIMHVYSLLSVDAVLRYCEIHNSAGVLIFFWARDFFLNFFSNIIAFVNK